MCIDTNKSPLEPAFAPIQEACRQQDANNVEKYARFPTPWADPNLRLIVNAVTILFITLAVIFGGLSETFAGFLLSRLQ